MRLISTLVAGTIAWCAFGGAAGATAAANKSPLRIQVDATDTVHKVFSVTEFIPLHGATTITLLYPRWEIGSHAPTISVADLAGLQLRVNGKSVEWQRDPLNVHAFHVSPPRDASLLEAHFNYLSPLSGGVMTANIVQVQWEHLLLYPSGEKVKNIPVVAAVTFPAEFHAASSLEVDQASGGMVRFKQCNLEELADAPLFAGRFMRSWRLSAEDAAPVWLRAVSDEASELAMSAPQLVNLRRAVARANTMFGGVPFRHYDFLVSLSDQLPHDGGSEHQESAEISLPGDFFLSPEKYKASAPLFPHEYVHAWNGLSHRPAGMLVADFNTPMQDGMLWVYEGLTELWGLQIARESELISEEDYRDVLAIDAAEQVSRPGRRWKSLADSDNDPVYLAGHHVTWRDWERREDYYTEGVLLWLGVDAKIRQLTNGKKSLQNFALAFFSRQGAGVSTYTFASLTATLNGIAPFAWKPYFAERLNAHDGAYLLDSLQDAGYTLVFGATESSLFAEQEEEDGVLDLSYSMGMRIRKSGVLQGVTWDGMAFKAGLAPGMTVTAVDGEAFSLSTLRKRLQNSSTGQIRLTVRGDGGEVKDVNLDSRDGLSFPHLRGID